MRRGKWQVGDLVTLREIRQNKEEIRLWRCVFDQEPPPFKVTHIIDDGPRSPWVLVLKYNRFRRVLTEDRIQSHPKNLEPTKAAVRSCKTAADLIPGRQEVKRPRIIQTWRWKPPGHPPWKLS